MCGRYLMLTEEENFAYREIINEVNERYKNTPLLSSMKSGEIFPSEIAPVLVNDQNKQKAALMKWGFPKWQSSGVIINARAETALERKLFRQPLISRRCAIPAAGFFEWRNEEGKKIKYLFRNPDTPVLFFAGVFDSFSFDNKPFDAYVILTATANEYVVGFHNRMPLILDCQTIDKWLCDTAFALDFIASPCDIKLYAAAV